MFPLQLVKDGPCFLGWAFRSRRLQAAAAELADWQIGPTRCRNAAGKAKALTLNSCEPVTIIHPSQAPKAIYRSSTARATSQLRTSNAQSKPISSSYSPFLNPLTFHFTHSQPSRCLQISGKQASLLMHAPSFVAIPGSLNHQHHRPRLALHVFRSSFYDFSS